MERPGDGPSGEDQSAFFSSSAAGRFLDDLLDEYNYPSHLNSPKNGSRTPSTIRSGELTPNTIRPLRCGSFSEGGAPLATSRRPSMPGVQSGGYSGAVDAPTEPVVERRTSASTGALPPHIQQQMDRLHSAVSASEEQLPSERRESPRRGSEDHAGQHGRNWLRGSNLKRRLRGKSIEDMRASASYPKQFSPQGDPKPPVTTPQEWLDNLSTISSPSSVSATGSSHSRRSVQRSSASIRTGNSSGDLSDQPKEKKRPFLWNPFGKKRDRTRELDMAERSASEGGVGRMAATGMGDRTPTSSTTSDPAKYSPSKAVVPLPLSGSAKKSKRSKSRDAATDLQLDLSGFSMDPLYIPHDIVSIPPQGITTPSPYIFPSPFAYSRAGNNISPDRPVNLPTPKPPLQTQIMSNWAPPESWGIQIDDEESPGRNYFGPPELWQPRESTDRGSMKSFSGALPTAYSTGDLRNNYEESVGGESGDAESAKGSFDRVFDERVSALRLFRKDGTFATISTKESTTTAELIAIMAKKSLISDYSRYNICVIRNGIERILHRNERPLFIQRRLFEQIGYLQGDKIEQLGREDNSYLCRFMFKEISTGTEIPSDFWRSSNFSPSNISLAGLNLATLPVQLFHYANEIVQLDVSRNPNIQEIPQDLVQSMEVIMSIMMSSNELIRFPRSLQFMRTLTEIDLSYNRITSLEGTGLHQVTGIKKLKLGGNLIERLPEDICHGCQDLEILELHNNRLRSFPVEVCRYLGRSLTTLDLSFNRIKAKIPEAIGELKKLSVLKLAANRMYGGLPWRFGELTMLRELDLRGNSFGALAGEEAMVMEVLERCKSLEVARLDANRVRWVGKWADHDADSEDDERRCLEYTKLRTLSLSHQYDPMNSQNMVFWVTNMTHSLLELDLRNSGIDYLPKRLWDRLPGLERCNVSGNRLRTLPDFSFGDSAQPNTKLRELNVSNNFLEYLPDDIGLLEALRILECQRNNLRELPGEVWKLGSLRTLNASSNLLDTFPAPFADDGTLLATNGQVVTFGRNRSIKTDGTGAMAMQPLSAGLQQTNSGQQQQVTLPPLSQSLQYLYLSDNHLSDDLYLALYHLPNLLSLHVSFNEITDITPWVVAIPLPVPMTPWFTNLRELHLSGNLIATLPGEIERIRALRLLFLNGNKLSTVPGEVGKLKALEWLDLGSQVGGRGEGSGLRYNVSNWPYDWNWNWNLDLKYLNLSGNRRLEIKPSASAGNFLTGREEMIPRDGSLPNSAAATKVSGKGGTIQAPVTSGALVANPSQRRRELTDFNALTNLRLLGLMDVTCLIVPPDETTKRRIRTTGSEVPMPGIPGGVIRYGIADLLWRPYPDDALKSGVNQGTPLLENGSATPMDEAFSVWDLVVPKFRGRENEALFGFFDGRGTTSGCQMAKYSFEWFGWCLANELEKLENTSNEYSAQPPRQEGRNSDASVSKMPTDMSGPTPRPAGVRSRKQTGSSSQGASGMPDGAGKVPVLDPQSITTAIRRTFLAINRELGSMGDEIDDGPPTRTSSDSKRWDPPRKASNRSTNEKPSRFGNMAGASAVIVFMYGAPSPTKGGAKCSMYIANVGDGMAVLSKAGGLAQALSKHHVLDLVGLSRTEAGLLQANMMDHDRRGRRQSTDEDMGIPTTAWHLAEMERVHNASGWFASNTSVAGDTDLTRAFGYFPLLGPINADAFIQVLELEFSDEDEAGTGMKRDMSLDTRTGQQLAQVVEDDVSAYTAATGTGGMPGLQSGDEFVVLATGAVWKAVRCGGAYEDSAQVLVDIARSAVASSGSTANSSAVANSTVAQAMMSALPGMTGGVGMTKSMSNLAAHQQQGGKPSGGWGTAAMKVRDVALGLNGGKEPGGFLVMVLGLKDLARKSAWWNAAGTRRGSAESSSESISVDDRRRGTEISLKERRKKGVVDENTGETLLKEIAPPVGQLALVFTDIKNSTSIWESNPVAMRAALRLHHHVMRRLLRQTGGYEVKTEGDAFMVSFQNILNAVDWCLTVQGELLSIDWPVEILNTVDGGDIWWQRHGATEFVSGAGLRRQSKDADTEDTSDMEVELTDDDGRPIKGTHVPRKRKELIFKGLSVRMGVHFGSPLCEVDPITSRMDYYGPMVNRAARVSGASQGGQVLISSDAMKELRSRLGLWNDPGQSIEKSIKSGEDLTDKVVIKDDALPGDEARKLKQLGIITWCIGEVKLKGLETPEVIYAVRMRGFTDAI
ncbi:hypothetical protein BC832DRAFT_410806 [Gaertneriomyces semiglobifer]|nr:hypothetical protein BC832DRAFT_410806 [Gaertneriomyces semiglobifer]